MTKEILVSPTHLDELIKSGGCTVVDCRFDLTNPPNGRAGWLKGHIPGAFYAHLDDDLAAPVEAHTGRHPLPDPIKFAQFLASIGWSKGKRLLAYDDGSNAISSRLWWLMRHFGQNAALLDGGLAAWIRSGLPLESGAPKVLPAEVESLEPAERLTLSADSLVGNLDDSEWLLLDARAQERYSGKVENLDTKAGHIPGSLNRPFSDNLEPSGCFKSPELLKAQFEALLGPANTAKVVHSCGSGVTACHNLFAMELAGLGFTRLYPGSWSEWIRDPERPVKTGMAP
jgi:thiosulfate/3-mercaptopyruvate sulfurtransferase